MRTNERGEIIEPCPACMMQDCTCPCSTCAEARVWRLQQKQNININNAIEAVKETIKE